MKYNPEHPQCILCEFCMYCGYDSYDDSCPKGEKEDKITDQKPKKEA